MDVGVLRIIPSAVQGSIPEQHISRFTEMLCRLQVLRPGVGMEDGRRPEGGVGALNTYLVVALIHEGVYRQLQ